RAMNSKASTKVAPLSEKAIIVLPVLLTPKEAAHRLKLSVSWLAKARMRGDGPAYIQVGRAVRYTETALLQWMKSNTRTSTSQQWLNKGCPDGSAICSTKSATRTRATDRIHKRDRRVDLRPVGRG